MITPYKDEKKAVKISDLLSLMAWTENPVYPCTAKYYLNEFKGFNIETYARVVDQRALTSYQKYAMKEVYSLTEETRKLLKL